MPQIALSKSAAQSLIADYSKVINAYSSDSRYSIEGIRNQLRMRLREVENYSLQVYEKLGYSGGSLSSIEAKFNQNLIKARQDTAALTGASLEQIFLSALRKATAYNESQQEDYESFLRFLEEKIVAEKGPIIENFEGEVATELFTALGKTFSDTLVVSSSTGKTRLSKKGTFAGYKFSRAFSGLSKSVQREVSQYIANNKANITPQQSSVSDTGLQMNWLINNVDINSFFRMKKQERELLFNKYPNLLSALNQSFKREILNSCSGANQSYLSRAIDKVILKRGGEQAFFVGGNIKAMTGVLGEIQAIYFLLYITNGSIDPNIEWVGGIGNPHSDILLKQALGNFGIQVKNTSIDQAEQEIEFQSFNSTNAGVKFFRGGFGNFDNTEEALKELDKLAPYELFNAVETMLVADVFNIEYQWYEGRAYAGDNEDFFQERELIEYYAKKAQQIMQLFSVSMMYMQNTELSNAQTNILYFVGGGIVRSAGTILNKIIFELESELHSFRMTMRNTGSASGSQKTIVDFLNAGQGNHNLNFVFQSSFNF